MAFAVEAGAAHLAGADCETRRRVQWWALHLLGKSTVARRARREHGFAMTKLAEIQEAIQQLPPHERQELLHWLTDEEPVEMLAAIDEADRSYAAEGGVASEDVRRKLKTWLTG